MPTKFKAKAHHAYSKQKPDEIDLAVGDVVRVSNDDHESWWVGRNETTNEQGFFPSNFVNKVAEPEKPKKQPSKKKRLARCITPYEAADEDCLSLQVGDVVEVGREFDGWCVGVIDGRRGILPLSHIETIPVAEEKKPQLPPTGRPLPVPPVPGGSTQPPPAPISRQSTASGAVPDSSLPQPPSLPSRQPPLPPRASTEVSPHHHQQAEGRGSIDEPRKEKSKSGGHRISRLFGTKKTKNKDGSAAAAAAAVISPPTQAQKEEEPVISPADHQEEEDEHIISPPLPNRPLPDPHASNNTSKKQPLPPIPNMASGNANPPPPAPAGAPPPVPAPAPASSAAPPPVVPPAVDRRPSAASSLASNKSSIPPATPLPRAPSELTESVPAKIAEQPEQEDKDEEAAASKAEKPEGGKEEEEDEEAAASKPRGGAKLAKILEDYEAVSSEELNLMSGDVVTIISRGSDDEPRWKGEYHGKKGYFPAHVVEPIEESADLEDEEGDATKPKGFKLAAYGVQQGGLGSIFAGGGGMPALRKAGGGPSSRKSSKDENADSSAPVPAPAPAPSLSRLRSVPQRPPPKEETQEEQPNFLAQLNRVPRKKVTSAASDDSANTPHAAAPVAPAVPAPAPAPDMIPSAISRKQTSKSDMDAETTDSPIGQSENKEELDGDKAVDVDADAEVLQVPVEKEEEEEEEDTTIPTEQLGQKLETVAESEAEPEELEDEGNPPASVTTNLEPVKSPALHNVRRLVRRGQRQKPTAEGLKKNSEEESQSQSLQAALRKDKDLVPEPEPVSESPVRAAPPTLPQKPKGLARHGPYGGPQLPTGGFKASGKIGSAMASRLAALQARASGNNDDDEGGGEEENKEESQSRPVAPRSIARTPSQEIPAAAAPAVRRPSSHSIGASSTNTSAPQSAAMSAEWQKKFEDEQARLRSDFDAARRSSQQVEQLTARLEASERENQAHKQTIAGLEQQIQSLMNKFTSLQSDLSGIQKSVKTLEGSKGVSSGDVESIIRQELKSAIQPLHQQNQELEGQSKELRKGLADLKAYVDELVVDEEE